MCDVQAYWNNMYNIINFISCDNGEEGVCYQRQGIKCLFGDNSHS